MTERVACIRVRHMGFIALARREPDLWESATAVVDQTGGAGVVLACSPRALREGVRVGMSVHAARGVAPNVTLRASDPSAIAAVRAVLGEIAQHVSPRVEVDGDRAYLDLTGLPHTEPALIAQIDQRARTHGLCIAIGIADGREVARIASNQANAHTTRGESTERMDLRAAHELIVPPGVEATRTFLAPLPVETLALSTRAQVDLARVGVCTLGALAKLTPKSVGTRLGPALARAVTLCRGEDTSVIRARTPDAPIEEGTHLDWEVSDLGALAFVLKRLLDALIVRVEDRSLALTAVEIDLRLASRARDVRTVGLPWPSRDVNTVLSLARASLEQRPPADAVVGARIAARTSAPRPLQTGLFEVAGPAPESMARTLAQLERVAGEGRVGVPEPEDSHRPHAIHVGVMQPVLTRSPEVTLRHPMRVLALHVLRPAWPARVELHEGVPRAFASEHVGGAVQRYAGPFRTQGGWWTDAPFDHEGFDVELEDGTLWLLAFDRTAGLWRVEGCYD